MQANEIWPGSDYAYVQNISRGVSFYPSAVRVKVIHVFKEKQNYGSERATTMVEVFMLRENGDHIKDYNGNDMVRNVRARNLYARWEEHATEKKLYDERAAVEKAERDARYAEQERLRRERYAREEEARRIRAEEAERQRREREERIAAERTRLLSALDEKGIPFTLITTIDSSTIYLSRQKVEEWLGLREKVESEV